MGDSIKTLTGDCPAEGLICCCGECVAVECTYRCDDNPRDCRYVEEIDNDYNTKTEEG